MGAESSSFSDLELDDALSDAHPLWRVQHGRYDDQNPVTVISNDHVEKELKNLFSRYIEVNVVNCKNVLNPLKYALHSRNKFLKKVRHPSILRFIASCNSGGYMHLVVERCTPLTLVVDDLEPLEICAGLHGLVEGLAFIHEKMGLAHNNVCPDAVYVAHNGAWKVGGLEHACKFLDVTPEFLQKSRKHRDEHSLSPEEKGNTLTVTVEMGHTRDVYSFGVMVECLLERLQELGNLIKTFEIRVQDECLNPDPRQRPKLVSLLDDQLFRNDLLAVRKFLQDITVKSAPERDIFFRGLTKKLLGLPEEVVGKHLTQLLLCRFVLVDQNASHFIPNLLTPCTDSKRPSTDNMDGVTPILSEHAFQKFLIPELIKVFHCHDYHIRMVLLSYFPYFVHLFDKDDLEVTVLPQVLLGIRDNNNDLAALSLHCLGDLVTVLGRDVVIGGKSKNYFTKGTPKRSKDLELPEIGNGLAGKTLLKDLASSSVSKVQRGKDSQIKKEEMERKRKERQERQRAARMKREQAKTEKSKAEQEVLKDTNLPSEDRQTAISEVSVREPARKVVPDVDNRINIGRPDISEHGSSPVGKGPVHRKSIADDMPLDPDIYISKDGNPSSEDDWSDWENDMTEKGGGAPNSQSVVQETPSPVDLLPDSPKMEKILKDRELKLKKDDDLHSSLPIQSYTEHYVDKPERQISTDKEITSTKTVNKPVLKNALKLQSKKKSKPRPSQKSETLGSEFDIKSIKVKKSEEKVTPEFDFFADMAPDIKSVTSLEDKLLGTLSEGDKSHDGSNDKSRDQSQDKSHDMKRPDSSKLAYQAADTSGETAGGWEEDFNWDEGF